MKLLKRWQQHLQRGQKETPVFCLFSSRLMAHFRADLAAQITPQQAKDRERYLALHYVSTYNHVAFHFLSPKLVVGLCSEFNLWVADYRRKLQLEL